MYLINKISISIMIRLNIVVEVLRSILLSLMFLHIQEREQQARKQLSCGRCSLCRAFVSLLLSLVHLLCQHKEVEVCFLVQEVVG